MRETHPQQSIDHTLTCVTCQMKHRGRPLDRKWGLLNCEWGLLKHEWGLLNHERGLPNEQGLSSTSEDHWSMSEDCGSTSEDSRSTSKEDLLSMNEDHRSTSKEDLLIEARVRTCRIMSKDRQSLNDDCPITKKFWSTKNQITTKTRENTTGYVG